MATSGTYATFNIGEILEEAYERAGLELKSGYDLRTGIRSFNFLMAEWANRGLNLWTIDEETQALTASDGTYTLTANSVDVLDAVIRNAANTDIAMERITATQWAYIPDKTITGIPNSYMVQRGQDSTTINLWPVPVDNTMTLVYWRLRRIQEAGNIRNDPDVPFRFIDPLVWGLAFHIASKKNQAIAPALKMAYEDAWTLASDEDRDRSSFYFYPDVT